MTPISEAEAVVMEVLWQQAPRSADEVVAALAHRDWAEPTIKTLLNRLLPQHLHHNGFGFADRGHDLHP